MRISLMKHSIFFPKNFVPKNLKTFVISIYNYDIGCLNATDCKVKLLPATCKLDTFARDDDNLSSEIFSHTMWDNKYIKMHQGYWLQI